MARGDDVTITASVGCAVTVHESADAVIARADQAMYLAKRSGDAIATAPAPQGPEQAGSRGADGLDRSRQVMVQMT